MVGKSRNPGTFDAKNQTAAEGGTVEPIQDESQLDDLGDVMPLTSPTGNSPAEIPLGPGRMEDHPRTTAEGRTRGSERGTAEGVTTEENQS